MASTTSTFFFLFDFYHMKGDSDREDLLSDAIIYFYPIDVHIKQQKLLDCGEIVGLVQFFKHDLFSSTPKTIYFRRSIVAHEHFGRHSGFLSLSQDRFSPEETHVHLQRILSLFNKLYGTWNYVHSLYPSILDMHTFLNQALTPIVNYVFTHDRSIPSMFSTIDYVSLRKASQTVLLDTKHCLDYLKTKHGFLDGLIGYGGKLLYSTFDTETTFCLQAILRIQNELTPNLIHIPRKSEEKLKEGVTLMRIFLPRSAKSSPILSTTTVLSTTTTFITDKLTITPPIEIVNRQSSGSDETSSSKSDLSSTDLVMSDTDNRRSGLLSHEYLSPSSDDAGFDTDPSDDLPSPSFTDKSSMSSSLNSFEKFKEDSNDSLDFPWQHDSLTDDAKLDQQMRTRSSTLAEMEKEDFEQTLKPPSSPQSLENDKPQIRLIEVFTPDNYIKPFENLSTSTSPQQLVFRSLTASKIPQKSTPIESSKSGTVYIPNNREHGLRISWKDIPDINLEQEKEEYILYIQRNSRMIFAGIIESKNLSDEYLHTLWRLMLHQFADMETQVEVNPPVYDTAKSNADVKFTFNENSRLVDFERVFDGSRNSRRLPSEECAFIAFTARTELNRNIERKTVELLRGDNLISVERRLPDRATYLCRRVHSNF